MAQKKKAAECSGDGSQTQTSEAMIEGNRPDDALATNANSPSAAFANTSRIGSEAQASDLKGRSQSEEWAEQMDGALAGIDGGPGKVPA